MSLKEVDINQIIRTREGDLLNPFPGLRPFGFEESHLFFGREGQSDDILIKLAKNRFAAVIGASGSGKSSLMYCGLIPVIYGGFMTDVGSDWVVITTRPGNSPMANLAESVVRLNPAFDKLSENERILELTIAKVILKSSSLGLVDALKPYSKAKGKQTNFLILIDQFEELFRFLKRENDIETANLSAGFVNLLLKSVKQKELPIYVAITMRSDFIGDCAQFPDLTQIINKSHYLIPQMTREQQRLAIEGPIAVGGGKITRRLTQQLLNDVGNNPDQLPILQHALMRTWDFWINNMEEGEPLDLRHYIAIGKLEEALSQHANETFSELDKREREICEVIFKSLTEKGRENYGIRRAAKISELASIANVGEEEIITVVEKFRKPGRSILMPPAFVPLKSDTIVEISHESLMRIWDRLKNWVDEEYESAQMYRRLSDAAAMYQVGRTGLWRPPDLQLALNWQKKQQPTRAWAQRYNPVFERAMLFLETSKTAYENEQRSKELLQKNMLRKARNVAVAMGIFTVVSIIFFIFALIQKVEADEKAREATQNALKVGREQEKATLQAREATRQALWANNRSELAEIRRKDAEMARQQAELQKRIAMNEQKNAERQRNLAEQSEQLATRRTVEAQDARQKAVTESNNALRLRMLSIAQTMALRSVQINDNQLEGNVALKAYQINQRNAGNIHDRAIYDGLYYGLKNLLFAEIDSVYSMNRHNGIVRGVAFSNNNNFVYSAGADGRIFRWDAGHPNNPPLEIIRNNTRNRVIRLTSDDKWLIVGTDRKDIELIDLESNRRKPDLIKGHEGAIFDIELANKGKSFISLSDDRSLRLYDDKQNRFILLRAFKTKYEKMAMSPDSKILALGSSDGKLVLLDGSDVDQETLIHESGGSPVNSLVFHPSDDILAVGYDNGIVEIYDVTQGRQHGKLINELSGHQAGIIQVLFDDHGNYLATAGFDGVIQLWNYKDLNLLPLVFRDHGTSNYVWSIAFSKDSNFLYAGLENGNIKIWPTKTKILAGQICPLLKRDMSKAEWNRYVADDINYEKTCSDIDLP